MFNLFKKKKTKILVTSESVDVTGEYIKDSVRKFAELESALNPLRNERSKAKFIIKQIYAQHNIDTGESWVIYDYCLDSDTFTDLCVFNDSELASLRKWTQRYKELETEIMNLIDNYHSGTLCEGDK